MPHTWKNKIIEKCFNYTSSIVKEMTEFIETSVQSWSLRKIRKSVQQLPQNPGIRSPPRKGNKQTPTPVS